MTESESVALPLGDTPVLAPQVGLEPTTNRLTADCSTNWAIEEYVLPRREWSGKRGSNSRPPPWQGGALPLSYFRIVVVRDGIEPPTRGFSVPCSTDWATWAKNMATPIRFELTIFAVTGRHVKPLHHGAISHISSFKDFSVPRTRNIIPRSLEFGKYFFKLFSIFFNFFSANVKSLIVTIFL